MLLILISTKLWKLLQVTTSGEAEIIQKCKKINTFFLKKRKTSWRGNALDSFKLWANPWAILKLIASHNHLQTFSGNSPDRVWKNNNFGRKFGFLHFSSRPSIRQLYKHLAVSTDLPFVLMATWGHMDSFTLRPTVMETDLPHSVFVHENVFSPQKQLISAEGLGAASVEFALLTAFIPWHLAEMLWNHCWLILPWKWAKEADKIQRNRSPTVTQ